MVDHRAVPVVGGQSGEDIAEQLCRIRELTGHVLGLLLGITIVHNSLITSGWGTVRPIHTAGREYPLALYQQHVAQVASVLQGRPHAWSPSGSQVNSCDAQECHNLGDPLSDVVLDGPRLTEVVNETAVPALICHPASVIERVWQTPQRRV